MGHSGARRIGASRNAAIGMVPFPATIRGERARDTGRSVLQGEASSVSAKGYTFGVEEEYQIIDPETRGLSPRGAGVLSSFPPNFDEQIGRAIHHLRHLGKTWSNIYKAEQFDKALHPIEIAHGRLDDGQMIQCAMARHLVGLF